MSSTLRWRPQPVPSRDSSFGDALKHVLRSQMGWGGDAITDWRPLDETWLPFLTGVVVGAPNGNELQRDAQLLINLITEHGIIEVREEQ